MNYIDIALEAWRNGADLRQRRTRYKHYTYGRQWCDMVTTPKGISMPEGEYAALTGRRPLTNNMIRQLVKCVIGNFRSSLKETDPATEIPREVSLRNSLEELDCRMLEEFLISGCAIQRVVTERRMSGDGIWVDNVSPDNFFVNKYTDPRGSDIELTGMLHDWSLRETLMRLGGNNFRKEKKISAIYNEINMNNTAATPIGDATTASFMNAPQGRCRVIEVWTLESRNILKCHDKENASYYIVSADSANAIAHTNAARRADNRPEIDSRRRTTVRWHCRYFAPTGEILDEYDSPYAHGMHPFAIKFYPLTDGEVHSFVEDIIDQQRYINRLITLIDHIMSVSAKGVLLFPMDQKPDCYSWEEIGELWAHCSSIIPYERGNSDTEPKQIISSGENAGAYHLLDLQMQLFQQISGVSGALQGQLGANNTSAALYEAQVKNSAIAILDIIDTFHSFRTARNNLILHC